MLYDFYKGADNLYPWTNDPMLSGVKDCDPDVVNDCLMHLKYENTSDAIQNMYETGRVETQTRAFEQLKQMRHSTFDLSKFEVVGSPVISEDGILNSCGNGKYVQIPTVIGEKTFKVRCRFKITGTEQAIIGMTGEGYTSFLKQTNAGTLVWTSPFADGSELKFSQMNVIEYTGQYVNTVQEFDGSVYTFSAYTDSGKLIVSEQIIRSDYLSSINGKIRLGVLADNTPTVPTTSTGSIDLKQFSIHLDGKEVFSGNKTGIDVIKSDNYEVVGSPTISDDGISSGFSANDYIKTGLPSKTVVNTEINMLFKMGSLDDVQILCAALSFGKFQISYDNGKMILWFGNNKGWTVRIDNWLSPIQNTEYSVKIVTSASEIKIYVNGTLTKTVPQTNFSYDLSYIGVIGSRTYATIDSFNGSIDLNAFKIYVDGNLVYQPCLKIPYTESKTGSKIVDGVYRDRVIDLYEQQGQAGYYTIDETNKNFTLPMGEIYGMIEQKGTYHPPLLSTMWSDHLINEMSWLRADTFSWQDGNTYSKAYNELLTEYNDSSSVEETEGEITFKRTPKGYKIALATQETAIDTKYTTDGIAWYYILDTTNTQFKLPRTKFGFEGLRGNVGDNIDESLPNITGTFSVTRQNNYGTMASATGVFTDNGLQGVSDSIFYSTDKLSKYNQLGFNAHNSNSAYQDNAPVQERATQMYLYFYVGEFTKSAEAQTAGLKAELLNGKQDVCIHIIDTYVNGTSGYRIWSDGYCEQWGDFQPTSSTLNTAGSNVSLLKTYKDKNYCLITAQKSNSGSATNAVNFGYIVSTSVISMCYYGDTSTDAKIQWRTYGYIN